MRSRSSIFIAEFSWEAGGLARSAYDGPNRHLAQDDLGNGRARFWTTISVSIGCKEQIGKNQARREGPGPGVVTILPSPCHVRDRDSSWARTFSISFIRSVMPYVTEGGMVCS